MYGRVGNSTSEISISDFYRQAWNARIVGFISPVPEETEGEDLAILAGLALARQAAAMPAGAGAHRAGTR